MANNPRFVTRALVLAALLAAPVVQAIGFGDMFNPGRWFGGNYDDDYYYDGPYGYGAGPYGIPGYGGYGFPGYGGYGFPGYGGYGVPGYGYGTAPYGYGAPILTAPSVAAPATGSGDAKDREIEALKRRIDQLENQQRGSPSASAREGWPAAPAFRPMDQY